MANIPDIGAGNSGGAITPPANQPKWDTAIWKAYREWVAQTYGRTSNEYIALIAWNQPESLELAMKDDKFNFWYSNGMPTKTDRATGKSEGGTPQTATPGVGKDGQIDPEFLQWLVTTYGSPIANAIVSGNSNYTYDQMFEYWNNTVKTTTQPATEPTDPTGAQLPPKPADLPGFYLIPVWDELEGAYRWEYREGTLGADEKQRAIDNQLAQDKFKYQQEYDAWQKEQDEAKFAYEKEQDEKNFQLSLQQVYAELQKNPQNWIAASDFISKMKPGETQPLTTPGWLAPITGKYAGAPLASEGGGYVAPKVASAQMYGNLTPTQRSMYEGYGIAAGLAPGDIGSAVEKSLPKTKELGARWKPATQV